MSKLISSASRVVFIIITLTACAGFFLKILDADNFMILAASAFSYYFGSRQVQKPEEPIEPFLGNGD